MENRMTKSKKAAVSKWYLASYPDPAAKQVRMKIVTAKLQAAENGNKEEQDKICAQYKRKAGLEIFIDWKKLLANLKMNTDQTSNTSSGSPQKHEPTGECDCDCVRCDQGYHCHNPRNRCNIQP